VFVTYEYTLKKVARDNDIHDLPYLNYVLATFSSMAISWTQDSACLSIHSNSLENH
jgi:hypothetical protein